MRFLFALILAGLCAEAQPVKPFLRIETGAHTAAAYRVDSDAAGRFLVSASADKTARVWDLQSGKLLKILRPPIDDADGGSLYALAISPDGNSIAVGGITGTPGPPHSIYIFDRASGNITKSIPGLKSAVHRLAYSRDGRYLAAGLAVEGIRVFAVPDYSLTASDADYADEVYGLEFASSGMLVATSVDGLIRLYDSQFHLLLKRQAHSGKQRYLRQGTDMLNVRRYTEAQAPLEQARKLNPFSPTANCGLEAIRVDGLRNDKVVFEQRLNEAIREYPRCAYLTVLSGEQKYGQEDLDGALGEYQAAIQREPQLAEGYFRMGRILDRQGKPDDALAPYQKAVQLSPATARYANNLADLYFRREDYDKAIDVYGRIDRFPLAALDLAKVYRLQGKLEEAREQMAVEWLRDSQLRNEEQHNPWAFDSGASEQVQLWLIDEKDCYARLELAITVFLQTGESQAFTAIASVLHQCSHQQELKDILRWELRRLSNQNPALGSHCDEITGRLLGGA